MDTRAIANKIVDILEDKKAHEVNMIDIQHISILADFFILASGTSSTHIRALADEVTKKLKEAGIDHARVEGYDTAKWILLDYGFVVIHIFNQEDRAFYNLERLWSDGIITTR